MLHRNVINTAGGFANCFRINSSKCSVGNYEVQKANQIKQTDRQTEKQHVNQSASHFSAVKTVLMLPKTSKRSTKSL